MTDPCQSESAVGRGAEAPAADGSLLVRGATSIIPQQLVGEGEIVILALKPSLWFILLVSARWLAVSALAIAAAEFLHPYIDRLWAGRIEQAALLAAAVRLVVGALQWQGRVYVLTDRRVMRLRGVLRIDLFQCKLSQIQHTELTLPLAERVLLTGTVLFYTAGTDFADAAWRTVAHPAQVYQTVLEAVDRYRSRPGG
ncbi:MAG: hypothetical protein BIFFINMI_02366 [Phycisphaerae bacterium]|nr:hypothetical protein [Phycisphaerae bacterium]